MVIRKPLDQMSAAELRDVLRQQQEASRVRGQGYRAKKAGAGEVRFSAFVPKDAVEAVRQAVRDVVRQHQATAPLATPSSDAEP